MSTTNQLQYHSKDSSFLCKIVQLLMMLVFFSIFFLSYLPGGNQINNLVCGTFIVLVVFVFLTKIDWRLFISSEIILMLVWCLYGLAISIFATNPETSLYKAVTMVELAILTVCVSNVIIWSGNIRLFMHIFVIAALLSYLVSHTPLFELSIEPQYHSIGKFPHPNRVVGTLRDANRFGLAMVKAQFMLVYLLATSVVLREKLWIIGASVVLVIAVIESGSRTALMGLIILVLLAAWVFHLYRALKQSKRVAFFILLLATIVLSSLAILKNNPWLLKRYTTTANILSSGDIRKEGTSHSIRGRYAHARRAWSLFTEHPLGIGLANYAEHSTAQSFSHSNYLEILVTTGVIGLLLYYAIYLALFRKASLLPFQSSRTLTLRRVLLIFPLVIATLDIGLVNYYSKDLWLSISLVSAALYLAKQKRILSENETPTSTTFNNALPH